MPERSAAVLVVGGGPAGIAAATTAATAGLATVLIDEGFGPGGQIWRGASPASSGPAGRWLRALRASGCTVLTRTRVVAQPEPGLVVLETTTGPQTLRYHRAILCPGARELFLPFPGWTLPGVTGAGGLQALVKNGHPIAGERVVVAGSGPLLLAVADHLEHAGAEVVRLVEQAPGRRVRAFAASLWRHPGKAFQALGLLPQAWRAQTDSWVVRADGGSRLERVELNVAGRRETVPCSYLACGFGLIPNLELPALFGCRTGADRVLVDESLATSRSDVWCAGEVLGIGGVDAALIEGRLTGHAVAGQADAVRDLQRQRVAIRRFADLVARTFALRDDLKHVADPTTLLCRCEDVPLEAVSACHSWREARLLTRCGMGTCQGRVCGAAAGFLHGWTSATTRPPLQPTTLDHLCRPHRNDTTLQEHLT
jgi:D-hydroxyproline dehydrogenase subunit alpha